MKKRKYGVEKNARICPVAKDMFKQLRINTGRGYDRGRKRRHDTRDTFG